MANGSVGGRVLLTSGLGLVFNGGLAQLVEHLLCKQGVIGSNPLASILQGWLLDFVAPGFPGSGFPGSGAGFAAEVVP